MFLSTCYYYYNYFNPILCTTICEILDIEYNPCQTIQSKETSIESSQTWKSSAISEAGVVQHVTAEDRDGRDDQQPGRGDGRDEEGRPEHRGHLHLNGLRGGESGDQSEALPDEGVH